MASKFIKVEFSLNAHKCAVEQDATGYRWYYVENMERPLEPSCVGDELRMAAEGALEEALKTVTVTEKERAVLLALVHNDFGDGEPNAWVWSDCIDSSGKPCGITGKALGGVVSSLCAKGLAETDGNTGRDACIRTTDAGRAAVV